MSIRSDDTIHILPPIETETKLTLNQKESDDVAVRRGHVATSRAETGAVRGAETEIGMMHAPEAYNTIPTTDHVVGNYSNDRTIDIEAQPLGLGCETPGAEDAGVAGVAEAISASQNGMNNVGVYISHRPGPYDHSSMFHSNDAHIPQSPSQSPSRSQSPSQSQSRSQSRSQSNTAGAAAVAAVSCRSHTYANDPTYTNVATGTSQASKWSPTLSSHASAADPTHNRNVPTLLLQVSDSGHLHTSTAATDRSTNTISGSCISPCEHNTTTTTTTTTNNNNNNNNDRHTDYIQPPPISMTGIAGISPGVTVNVAGDAPPGNTTLSQDQYYIDHRTITVDSTNVSERDFQVSTSRRTELSLMDVVVGASATLHELAKQSQAAAIHSQSASRTPLSVTHTPHQSHHHPVHCVPATPNAQSPRSHHEVPELFGSIDETYSDHKSPMHAQVQLSSPPPGPAHSSKHNTVPSAIEVNSHGQPLPYPSSSISILDSSVHHPHPLRTEDASYAQLYDDDDDRDDGDDNDDEDVDDEETDFHFDSPIHATSYATTPRPVGAGASAGVDNANANRTRQPASTSENERHVRNNGDNDDNNAGSDELESSDSENSGEEYEFVESIINRISCCAQVTPAFRRRLASSLLTSLAIGIASFFTLYPPIRDAIVPVADPSFAVVMVTFVVGDSMGETIMYIKQAQFGVALAGISTWILTQLFGSSATAVCLYGPISAFVFSYLPLSMTVKKFVLGLNMWYMVDQANPDTDLSLLYVWQFWWFGFIGIGAYIVLQIGRTSSLRVRKNLTSMMGLILALFRMQIRWAADSGHDIFYTVKYQKMVEQLDQVTSDTFAHLDYMWYEPFQGVHRGKLIEFANVITYLRRCTQGMHLSIRKARVRTQHVIFLLKMRKNILKIERASEKFLVYLLEDSFQSRDLPQIDVSELHAALETFRAGRDLHMFEQTVSIPSVHHALRARSGPSVSEQPLRSTATPAATSTTATAASSRVTTPGAPVTPYLRKGAIVNRILNINFFVWNIEYFVVLLLESQNDIARGVSQSWKDAIPKSLPAVELNWSKVIASFKIALALLIALVLGIFVFDYNSSAAVTIGYVMGGSFGTSWRSTLSRILGTVFGSISAYTMLLLVEDNPYGITLTCMFLVALFTFVRLSPTSYSYMGFVASFIVPIVMYQNYGDQNSLQSAQFRRIEQTFVGVVVFITVELFVLPARASISLRNSIVEFLHIVDRSSAAIVQSHTADACPKCQNAVAVRVWEESVITEAMLTEQRELLLQAEAEPSLWKPAFATSIHMSIWHNEFNLRMYTVLMFRVLYGSSLLEQVARLESERRHHHQEQVLEQEEQLIGLNGFVRSHLAAGTCSSDTIGNGTSSVDRNLYQPLRALLGRINVLFTQSFKQLRAALDDTSSIDVDKLPPVAYAIQAVSKQLSKQYVMLMVRLLEHSEQLRGNYLVNFNSLIFIVKHIAEAQSNLWQNVCNLKAADELSGASTSNPFFSYRSVRPSQVTFDKHGDPDTQFGVDTAAAIVVDSKTSRTGRLGSLRRRRKRAKTPMQMDQTSSMALPHTIDDGKHSVMSAAKQTHGIGVESHRIDFDALRANQTPSVDNISRSSSSGEQGDHDSDGDGSPDTFNVQTSSSRGATASSSIANNGSTSGASFTTSTRISSSSGVKSTVLSKMQTLRRMKSKRKVVKRKVKLAPSSALWSDDDEEDEDDSNGIRSRP
jgi:Fusaric acid resistance protein-like